MLLQRNSWETSACASGPDAYCGNESVLARDLAAGEYVAIVKTSTPTSFVLSLSSPGASESTFEVLWCADSTTSGDQTKCELVP